MYDVMRMCALFRKQLNFPTKHPWASYIHVHVYRARACTIIGASLSEPLLDELAGAILWGAVCVKIVLNWGIYKSPFLFINLPTVL